MSSPTRVLLLSGSPKGKHSTSESLGTYLLGKLAEQGSATESVRITPHLSSETGRGELRTAISDADLIILSFPLYVDSHPAPVIRLMEFVAADWRASLEGKSRRLVAIVNCGFPEARHCDTALAITRRFAVESSIEWAGGLALGGGEAIGGKPLTEAGGMARSVRRSLDIAAAALARGASIPDEAVHLMAKPLMPTWLYTGVGGFGWRWKARTWGAQRRLRDRPFEA